MCFVYERALTILQMWKCAVGRTKEYKGSSAGLSQHPSYSTAKIDVSIEVRKMRLQGASRKGNDLVAANEVERGNGNK